MNWTEDQLERHLKKFGLPGAERNTADTSAPPFALPQEVVLDLPPPISVNTTRKINWSARPSVAEWRKAANGLLFLAKTRSENPLRFERVPRFELQVVLSEDLVLADMDNTLKIIIDYLVSACVLLDDAPKNMRGLHVSWGEAPTGCRVTVRPCA